MASPSLSSLSPELICLILQKVHSGSDLYAFLQKSSYIYGAFTASRDLIIWNLARCSMVPKVLVDAVTAVELRNMECGFDEVEQKNNEISALARDKLLETDGKRPLPQDLISSADLLALRRLQCAIEYLIDGYCSLQLPALFTSSTSAASGLSDTELARLQRAFYMYDICQTMWYYPGRFHNHWGHRTSGRQLCPLFTKSNPWEIEEVSCILQYLHKRMDGIFDDLGEIISLHHVRLGFISVEIR
jgi:hypothetical protein